MNISEANAVIRLLGSLGLVEYVPHSGEIDSAQLAVDVETLARHAGKALMMTFPATDGNTARIEELRRAGRERNRSRGEAEQPATPKRPARQAPSSVRTAAER